MIEGSKGVAKLTIRKASKVYVAGRDWLVDWELLHRLHNQERARGRVCFSNEDLQIAFASGKPADLSGDLSEIAIAADGLYVRMTAYLRKTYGAEFADQGKYIRLGSFLNIPCPGSGRDGDPNISIFLYEELSEAVRKLLES